jgi:hypothetical protein
LSDDEFEQYWDYPNRKAMERAGMKNSEAIISLGNARKPPITPSLTGDTTSISVH